MRILHVLNYAYPWIDGYTVRSIGLLTAQHRSPSFEPSLAVSPFAPLAKGRDEGFTTAAWGPDRQHSTAESGPSGLRCGPRPWERPAVGLSPVTGRRFARRLSKIARSVRAEVIHSHHPHYVGSAARRVARRLGIPFVYELRCINGDYDLDQLGPYSQLRGRWQNRTEFALCRAADHVVTISDGLRDRIARRGIDAGRITVVRNSVDTDLFRPDRAADAARNPGVFHVGYATTFEAIENLDTAVRAAEAIKDNPALGGRRLRMTLAGKGRDWERIAGLVRDLGLDGTVDLPGFVPYGEMPALHRSFDLFLVPRRHATVSQDTTPLKPLEALACGRPVLASDLPAMRSLLGSRSDVRFCEPTEEGIARGLLNFAASPWPASGGIDDRSWAHEIEKYAGVYEAAAARAGVGRVSRASAPGSDGSNGSPGQTSIGAAT